MYSLSPKASSLGSDQFTAKPRHCRRVSARYQQQLVIENLAKLQPYQF